MPKVVLPVCGIFQVSDVDRLHRRRALPLFLRDRLETVALSYLPEGGAPVSLADPLLVLEDETKHPARPLPPFFLIYRYPRPSARSTPANRTPSAFHALVLRESARRCWAHRFAFLARHL